jgi:monoamine oxidase
MVEGWSELLDKMGAAPEDITLDAFLESEYPGAEYEGLRRHARSYAAGFDLADPVYASIRSLYREWTNEGGEQYRIKEGYKSIIDHLYQQCISKNCQVLTGKKAVHVNWQKDEVSVKTADGETFIASKLIITIPAGIMKKTAAKAAINITPALDQYIDAYRKIGYGSVLKIILRFYEPFWKEKESVGFIISEEIIPTWWTQLPDESPVLTGWLGGPAAVQWSGIDSKTILNHAINSLAAIFKMTAADIRNRLLEHYIFNWHNVETACGAYSYDTPLSAGARTKLNTPVEDTIYFAGEALYEGRYPGTVEAALTTGIEVAKKIRKENILSESNSGVLTTKIISE